MTIPSPHPNRRAIAWIRGLLRLGAVLCAVAAVVALIVWVSDDDSDDAEVETPDESPGLVLDPQDIPGTPTTSGTAETAPTTTATTTATTGTPGGADEIPRILVAGDSVSAQIGWSLQEWSDAHPGVIDVWNESHIGCGTVRYGLKRVGDGSFGPVGDICSNWAVPVSADAVADDEVVSWPTAVEVFRPDIVVIIISAWDVTDRIIPYVVDDWSTIGDPAYDAYVRQEYTVATDVLTAGGATLYWLVSPVLNGGSVPIDHPDRIDGINRIVREAAALLDDRDVRFLDYPAFIGPVGSPRELRMRDDGVHLSDEGYDEVGPWLVEQLGLDGSAQ